VIARFARFAPPGAALAALSACATDDVAEGPQLLLPGDIDLEWDRSFDGVGDGRVALVPVDVMVYDAETGEPLAGVALDVHVLAGDAGIVAPHDVLLVDPDEPHQDGVVWDAWRDRWFAFADPTAAAEPAARLATDDWGIARFWLFADAFPADDADPVGLAPIPLVVSMGAQDDTFLVVPR
jgi:hypothetical protein